MSWPIFGVSFLAVLLLTYTDLWNFCRQRNARVELNKTDQDPESLLAALHAEKISTEEEARQKAEQEEDDALVRQYFAKVAGPAGSGAQKSERTESPDGETEDTEGENTALPQLTVKRRPVPGTGKAGEPSVQSLLAAKGKVLETAGANGAGGPPQVKRKREGMQKLLGIKKKAKA